MSKRMKMLYAIVNAVVSGFRTDADELAEIAGYMLQKIGIDDNTFDAFWSALETGSRAALTVYVKQAEEEERG
jgi:hypothetical protein